MRKFLKWHEVEVAKEFPSCMQFFPGRGEQAIIIDCAENNGEIKYELLFKRSSIKFCWYEESLLTLVDSNRNEIITLFYKIINCFKGALN